MKDYKQLEAKYETLNKYIDEAINLLLKKQTKDCINVLEMLRIFSRSVFSNSEITDQEDDQIDDIDDDFPFEDFKFGVGGNTGDDK